MDKDAEEDDAGITSRRFGISVYMEQQSSDDPVAKADNVLAFKENYYEDNER